MHPLEGLEKLDPQDIVAQIEAASGRSIIRVE
ncbi:hypothetical protein N182_04800 [Sinorhizobium sp. GL2]|nr:hypothetical protein N182_04800 [Sinorhizobium sp. GL2]